MLSRLLTKDSKLAILVFMSVQWQKSRARDLLKEEGRSQRWLADKVGSTPAYISHLLTGVKNPSLTMLKLMAIALETTEPYLMGTSEERRPKEYRKFG